MRHAGSDIDQLIKARLYQHVHALTETIGERHVMRPKALNEAAAYIQEQWQAMGWNVNRESYRVMGQRCDNLIIQRSGTRKPQRIILVGAHYDTVPGTPGADDNASAVAMLLEISRLLKDVPHDATLRFVAFTNEEPPHFHMSTMGSFIHARGARQRGEKIDAMVCLEMVGYYRDEKGSQQYPAQLPNTLKWLPRCLPDRADFLSIVSNIRSARLLWPMYRGFRKHSAMRLLPLALPESIGEIRRSDHACFWDQGYRAVMVTDTSFMRNPHYHQPTDSIETLDFARMTQATLGMSGSVRRLAGSQKSWHIGQPAEDTSSSTEL